MFKRILVLLVVLSLAVTMAGCGQASETPKPAQEPTVEQLSGKVIVDGSGTVYPLMAHVAEEYMTKVQPKVSVQVGRAGTSAGFKKFVPGETDFADASRMIKDEEKAALEEKGLKFGTDILEFKVALDGLTMVINKDNTWAKEMTKDEIVNMYLAGKDRKSVV